MCRNFPSSPRIYASYRFSENLLVCLFHWAWPHLVISRSFPGRMSTFFASRQTAGRHFVACFSPAKLYLPSPSPPFPSTHHTPHHNTKHHNGLHASTFTGSVAALKASKVRCAPRPLDARVLRRDLKISRMLVSPYSARAPPGSAPPRRIEPPSSSPASSCPRSSRPTSTPSSAPPGGGESPSSPSARRAGDPRPGRARRDRRLGGAGRRHPVVPRAPHPDDCRANRPPSRPSRGSVPFWAVPAIEVVLVGLPGYRTGLSAPSSRLTVGASPVSLTPRPHRRPRELRSRSSSLALHPRGSAAPLWASPRTPSSTDEPDPVHATQPACFGFLSGVRDCAPPLVQ